MKIRSSVFADKGRFFCEYTLPDYISQNTECIIFIRKMKKAFRILDRIAKIFVYSVFVLDLIFLYIAFLDYITS